MKDDEFGPPPSGSMDDESSAVPQLGVLSLGPPRGSMYDESGLPLGSIEEEESASGPSPNQASRSDHSPSQLSVEVCSPKLPAIAGKGRSMAPRRRARAIERVLFIRNMVPPDSRINPAGSGRIVHGIGRSGHGLALSGKEMAAICS